MSESKKQKLSTDFFKPKEKSVPLKSEEIVTTAIPLQKVNYVGDCPLFSRCEPGVCYDIGLVVGALNQITENEKISNFNRPKLPSRKLQISNK